MMMKHWAIRLPLSPLPLTSSLKVSAHESLRMTLGLLPQACVRVQTALDTRTCCTMTSMMPSGANAICTVKFFKSCRLSRVCVIRSYTARELDAACACHSNEVQRSCVDASRKDANVMLIRPGSAYSCHA